MSGIWVWILILVAVALVVVAYLVFQRLALVDQRLARVRELHTWIRVELYPKYLLTHQKVWASGPGDPGAPPPPPPEFD